MPLRGKDIRDLVLVLALVQVRLETVIPAQKQVI